VARESNNGRNQLSRKERNGVAGEQLTWIYPSHCRRWAFIYFSSARTSIDGMAGGAD
jgi:hypothetical protein